MCVSVCECVWCVYVDVQRRKENDGSSFEI